MTPHNYEIVDCSAFCEVIFFCISTKNLLGDFFDSLSCRYPLFILHWKGFLFFSKGGDAHSGHLRIPNQRGKLL